MAWPISFIFVALCKPVWANVPIGGAFYLAFPLMTYIKYSSLALILVVFLESLVLKKMTGISLKRTLLLVLLANSVSSVAGVIISFSYSSTVLFLIMVLPIAFCFSKMTTYIHKKTSDLKHFSKYGLLIFCLLQFSVLPTGFYLYPFLRDGDQLWFQVPLDPGTVAAMFVLVGIGFILSTVIEAAAIIRFTRIGSSYPKTVSIKTVLFMNTVSYLFLIGIFGLRHLSQ